MQGAAFERKKLVEAAFESLKMRFYDEIVLET